MGFLMDGLDPEEYDRTYTDRQLVARIMSYFRPQARKMAVVAGAAVLIACKPAPRSQAWPGW